MEYAFLCYESRREVEARRIFDRLRKGGNAAAEQAYQNIDAPLAAGIERWKQAIAKGADSFSVHFELAVLAERRDEPELAAEHYEKAWQLRPDRRSVLVDLGRVWKALGRREQATAALLAASRGGEPRAAEMARELLPARYPYVNEFRRALELDSGNVELRRELGYLLLQVGRKAAAEREFDVITRTAPGDLLSAAQLGFLLHARGKRSAAMPLLERVLAGRDEDLANRVRAVLRVPQLQTSQPAPQPAAIDAKIMAERSFKAGYMKDALKYLEIAHQADPGDFEIMLKLGWTHNLLRQDALAFHWFDRASRSPDPLIASKAAEARGNLRAAVQRFSTTLWIHPVYSSRWRDLFSYAQVKTELRTGIPVRPYVSLRFVGDTRLTIGKTSPQYLSESAFIPALGVITAPWHGILGWAEAGSAMNYATGHAVPDYRGGLSMARGAGHSLASETSGWFADTAADAVFVSRFDNDFLIYDQSRFGYTAGPSRLRAQVYWGVNATVDARRQYWANYVETGPGVRFASSLLPKSLFVFLGVSRGAYLRNVENPRRPNFNDFRVGLWYAFVR
jgi:tetratricopeptide (TPR) repeat protein